MTNTRRRGDIAKILAAAEKMGGGAKKNFGDDRQWKLKRDDADNGYAVLRFLPAVGESDLPWTQYWDHGFQRDHENKGGPWYIEKSRTSIGEPDPVAESNARLWNTGIEKDKTTARNRKRRLHYVANVFVVTDKANPENEGKVMMYTFGKKIYDKVMDAMNPEYPDEEPINPFDIKEGANFKLKCRKVDGWINYDKSEFASVSDMSDQVDLSKRYDLGEFTDPSKYKSYEELAARLATVLGTAGDGGTPSVAQMNMVGETTPAPQPKATPAPTPPATAEFDESVADDADDTSVLDHFAALAAASE